MFVHWYDGPRCHFMVITITEDLSTTPPLDFRNGLFRLLTNILEVYTPVKRVRVFINPMVNDIGHVRRIVDTLMVIIRARHHYVNLVRMKVRIMEVGEQHGEVVVNGERHFY